MVWPYTVFRYDRHGDTPQARVGSACSVIATSVKLHMGRQPQERMGSVSFTMHVRLTVERHLGVAFSQRDESYQVTHCIAVTIPLVVAH